MNGLPCPDKTFLCRLIKKGSEEGSIRTQTMPQHAMFSACRRPVLLSSVSEKKERKLSSLFHCVLPRSEMLRLRLLRASAFSVFIPVQRLGPGERTPLSFGSRDVFCRSASSAIHRGISGNARAVTRSFLLANLFHSVYLFIPGTGILFGPLRFGKQNTLGGKWCIALTRVSAQRTARRPVLSTTLTFDREYRFFIA